MRCKMISELLKEQWGQIWTKDKRSKVHFCHQSTREMYKHIMTQSSVRLQCVTIRINTLW